MADTLDEVVPDFAKFYHALEYGIVTYGYLVKAKAAHAVAMGK